MQVVSQHGVHCLGCSESLQHHAHGNQHGKGGDQKVSRAAAGVEDLQVSKVLRPAVKGTGGRAPSCLLGGIFTAHEAQEIERYSRDRRFPPQIGFRVSVLQIGFAQTARRPPGSQGVVEQEAHHVGLSEELRHRRQLVRPDLDFGTVDLVLLPGLPELVHPTEAVIRRKHGARQPINEPFEGLPSLGWQFEVEHRIPCTEDLRQRGLSEPRSHRMWILAGFPRQSRAFVHGDGHSRVRFNQQIALSQESGKQHTMPVLIGNFMGEAVNSLRALGLVSHVAQLPAVCPETVSQRTFFNTHRPKGFMPINAERLQGLTGPFLRFLPSTLDRSIQTVSKFTGKRCHNKSLFHNDRAIRHGFLEFLSVFLDPGLNVGAVCQRAAPNFNRRGHYFRVCLVQSFGGLG